LIRTQSNIIAVLVILHHLSSNTNEELVPYSDEG
jgi:hypothetical protein